MPMHCAILFALVGTPALRHSFLVKLFPRCVVVQSLRSLRQPRLFLPARVISRVNYRRSIIISFPACIALHCMSPVASRTNVFSSQGARDKSEGMHVLYISYLKVLWSSHVYLHMCRSSPRLGMNVNYPVQKSSPISKYVFLWKSLL